MSFYHERVPSHHPQVISRAVDEETLLLKLDTGQVSLLNEVGGEVWRLMDGNRKLGDIVQAVGLSYGVDQHRVEADVELFIQDLDDRDMLAWAPDEG
jgi:hypothetical protein